MNPPSTWGRNWNTLSTLQFTTNNNIRHIFEDEAFLSGVDILPLKTLQCTTNKNITHLLGNEAFLNVMSERTCKNTGGGTEKAVHRSSKPDNVTKATKEKKSKVLSKEEEDDKDVEKTYSCTICFEQNKQWMSLNCGHVLCGDCLDSIRNANNQCPHCRQTIVSFCKIFL